MYHIAWRLSTYYTYSKLKIMWMVCELFAAICGSKAIYLLKKDGLYIQEFGEIFRFKTKHVVTIHLCTIT